jgi:hypothetical protein
MPRPRFNPTEAQRLTVKSLAACGIRQEEIASKIGIRSPKTLRKHFAHELASGVTDANYKVAKTVYEKAVKGDMYAAQFWLRCRGGWKDRAVFEAEPGPPPLFIVAKDDGAKTR